MSEGDSVLIENWDKPVLTWLRRIPTLFIPFVLAFSFIVAPVSLFADPSFFEGVNKTSDESSRFLIGGAFALIVFPMIMALSWGMLVATRQVSNHLGKLSHIQKTGFGTVIGSWILALSKVHLYMTLFYTLAAIFLISGALYFEPEGAITQIFAQIGIPGRISGMFVLSVGAFAYVLILSFMVYVMGTLPLAIISACMFRIFSLNRYQYRSEEAAGQRAGKVFKKGFP